MTKPADRTLTAVHSPLAQGEDKDRAVLLMVGGAETPGLPAKARLQILGEELLVGRRAPDATRPGSHALVLNDTVVSGQHARLARVGGGGWEVEDLGSKNGTWVDNARLAEKTKLRDGAVIFFGNHVGIFRLASTIEVEAMK